MYDKDFITVCYHGVSSSRETAKNLLSILERDGKEMRAAYTGLNKLLRYFRVNLLSRQFGEDMLLEMIADAVTEPRVIVIAIPQSFLNHPIERKLLERLRKSQTQRENTLSISHIIQFLIQKL